MTIDEAIKILEEEKDYTSLIEAYENGDIEWAKAYNMAIEALRFQARLNDKKFTDAIDYLQDFDSYSYYQGALRVVLNYLNI